MPETRKQYDPEFKAGAVRQVAEQLLLDLAPGAHERFSYRDAARLALVEETRETGTV